MKKKRTIAGGFLKWLLIIVTVAFAFSLVFSWIIQTGMSRDNAATLLRINIEDVRQDIIDASDHNLLELTTQIANILDKHTGEVTAKYLEDLMKSYDVAEINVIDDKGIITATTYPDFLGFDMREGEQSSEFMVLLEGDEDAYVQSYRPITYDSTISRKYAAVTLKRGGFVQVAYDAERFQRDIDRRVVGVTRNRHVGEKGCIIAANENWLIVSDRFQNEGKNLDVTGIWIDRETMPEWEIFSAEVYGEKCWCMYTFTEGYYIISVMLVDEVVLSRDASVGMTAVMDVLVFVALFALVAILVHQLVIKNINKVNHSLSRITDGDLDVVVDVRSNVEFSSLSDDINSTVSTLKKYIAEAAARIDQELEFARAIQLSVLPRTFPAFPDRTDFDIYASMDPAKEVGGDFYDFFLVDDDHLALVIADVSGKGIPAALFMMTAKTLIKNLAQAGGDPSQILYGANMELCEGNDAELFVTVWLAIVELSTGKGVAANAGHEHPAIRRAGGSYELSVYRHSPPLGTMKGIRFTEHTFRMHPGDSLFVYTDGVAEATNLNNELFGTERMLETLNQNADAMPEELIRQMREGIDSFAGDAPQFDDITMLCFHYKSERGHGNELS
ncbi:MAG: serine/threonine-protein phosphatase [Lachnospiraceae bacterium]|nr:serine/threonine-protein phosphatase [Lachnospiraceae bacterium]